MFTPLLSDPSPSVVVVVAVFAPRIFMTIDPPTDHRTAESAVTPFDRNHHRHEQFLARIQEGPVDLLFIGDSITDGWPRDGEFSWLKFAP